MSDKPIRIKRYPNRRFYSSHSSRYISLPEIEQLIRDGSTVEIIDSQTGDDLTRAILVQIIAERHPDKIAVFPTALLHSMLRANAVVTHFLQAYLRNALAYLEQLQEHGSISSFDQPMHWMKAWLDHWPMPPSAKSAPKADDLPGHHEVHAFAERIAQLEERLAELEARRGNEG